MRRLPVLTALLAFACAWSSTASAAAGADSTSFGPTAVLPADAAGLLPGAREALDAALLTALRNAGLQVLPPERTARFIKDAVDAGLNCSLADDDCALRAGVAAGADAVVLARAVRIDERLVMVLRLLSVDGSPPRAVAGTVDDVGLANGITVLARRLRDPGLPTPATPLPVPLEVVPVDAVVTVDGRPRDEQPGRHGHVWLVPGTHVVQVSAPGFADTQVVIDVPADRILPARRIELARGFPPLAAIGLGVAVVGGVVLGAGGIGTGIAELLLAQPLERGLRTTTQSTGQILMGTAVVGALAITGGAAVALVGLGE